MKETASKKLKPQAISFVVNGSLLSDFFFLSDYFTSACGTVGGRGSSGLLRFVRTAAQGRSGEISIYNECYNQEKVTTKAPSTDTF